jgi:hypothetical protein
LALPSLVPVAALAVFAVPSAAPVATPARALVSAPGSAFSSAFGFFSGFGFVAIQYEMTS